MNEMSFFPKHTISLILLILAAVALAVAIYLQLPMWLVVFTDRGWSAGGGEAMLAFLSLPVLFVSIGLTIPTLVKTAWKSRFGWILAGIQIVLSGACVVLFVIDP